jgi:predicted nuclease of predicted toxin-antitoxin system
MRILFDHNAPLPLRYSLRNYTVATTAERGWDRLTNGKLLDAAEEAGFDILLTADKGFQYQQNLTHRRIAIVILSRGNWPDVKMSIPKILDAINAAKGGACTLVECLMSFGTFIEEDAS